MSRIPLDIQFLLERILDESPDKIELWGKKSGGSDQSDPTRLNSLGAEVPKQGGDIHWLADDAYAFVFDDKNGVIMYVRKDTHGDMEGVLKTATIKAKMFPRTFKNMYKVDRDEFNNISIYSYKDAENSESGAPTTVKFIGLHSGKDDTETVVEYLSKNHVYFRNLDIRGTETEANEPSGRIWVKKHLVSFWNSKDKIMNMFPIVEKMMRSMKSNKTKFAYEFLDIEGLFAFSELGGKDDREKLSPEEMQAKLAQKHLKKDKEDYGSSFWGRQGKKAAKGFDIPAKADAAVPALETKIKLKDLINEDPDSMEIDYDDAEILNSKGAGVEAIGTHWQDNDAIPFYIDEKDDVIVFSVRHTHGRMERGLFRAAQTTKVQKTFESFTRIFEETSLGKCIGIESDLYLPTRQLYFYGLKDNTMNGLFEYIKRNQDNFLSLSIRGGTREDGTELSGRLWTDYNAISFWNKKALIVPHMRLITGFMSQIKMNPQKCVYEFIDSRRLYVFKDLGQAVGAHEKLSAAAMQDKLAKKHLEKDREDYGPDFWERHGKKAAKGFDYPAKAGAAMPALEGHIKLKYLLQENPDVVSSVEGGKIAGWASNDAVAFFAFPEFSVLNRGGVHYDIIDKMEEVYEELEHYLNDPNGVLKRFQRSKMELSNVDGLLTALSSGPLRKFYEEGGRYSSKSAGGNFRTSAGGLSGRLWTNKKIISFWNKKDDVVKQWGNIEKMFEEQGATIEDINDYNVDWLERDISTNTPMTPAKEISTLKSSSDNNVEDSKQENFLDRLFGEKEIGDDEIKKIQGKLHTLSAKEKKKVMLAMGYKNLKAADIADKLGMTVAEFNHIMNVNEGEI